MTELIYQQLLELYIADLEVELLVEKLKNVNTGTPHYIPVPYPWYQPRNPYDPPFIVTCQSGVVN